MYSSTIQSKWHSRDVSTIMCGQTTQHFNSLQCINSPLLSHDTVWWTRYEEPSYENFSKKLNAASKFCEDFRRHSHSAGTAEDGETSPEHLRDVLALYIKSYKHAEISEKQPSTSQQNRVIQDKIVGDCRPMGLDSNADPLSSVRTENEKSGKKLVKRKGEPQRSASINLEFTSSSGGESKEERRKTSNKKGKTCRSWSFCFLKRYPRYVRILSLTLAPFHLLKVKQTRKRRKLSWRITRLKVRTARKTSWLTRSCQWPKTRKEGS